MARPLKIDEKRKELLQKALSCFTRHGYAKTTLEDIAAETGIHKASLYHYFKNKEALFLQVLLQVSQQGLAGLVATVNKIKPADKQLIHYFSERLHLYLQIVRLNSLNKETLLHLQQLFEKVYQPEKENEIQYVAQLLQQYIPRLTKKQAVENTRLLFSVADAIKHNAVFTGHLLAGEKKELDTVKQQISRTITVLLKGLK